MCLLPGSFLFEHTFQSDVIVRFPGCGEVAGGSSMPQLIAIKRSGHIKLIDLALHDSFHFSAILWIRACKNHFKELQISNCKITTNNLGLLFVFTAPSSPWQLTIKNCRFEHTWTKRDSCLLRKSLCRLNLSSCLLSNLTSHSGPIFAGTVKASSSYEIR